MIYIYKYCDRRCAPSDEEHCNLLRVQNERADRFQCGWKHYWKRNSWPVYAFVWFHCLRHRVGRAGKFIKKRTNERTTFIIILSAFVCLLPGNMPLTPGNFLFCLYGIHCGGVLHRSQNNSLKIQCKMNAMNVLYCAESIFPLYGNILLCLAHADRSGGSCVHSFCI